LHAQTGKLVVPQPETVLRENEQIIGGF